MSHSKEAVVDQANRIRGYYRFQSKIYDLTRWSFLFGRSAILQRLPFEKQETFKALEVGCGTGVNLAKLQRLYPNSQLIGMDVSADMLDIARRRLPEQIDLIAAPYGEGKYEWQGALDAILFSYSLTMINPQWSELLEAAYRDLKPGGYIAVVDFHYSSKEWFRRHMSNHHVRMEGHLLPVLEQRFATIYRSVKSAYGGVWEYVQFVGKKAEAVG